MRKVMTTIWTAVVAIDADCSPWASGRWHGSGIGLGMGGTFPRRPCHRAPPPTSNGLIGTDSTADRTAEFRWRTEVRRCRTEAEIRPGRRRRSLRRGGRCSGGHPRREVTLLPRRHQEGEENMRWQAQAEEMEEADGRRRRLLVATNERMEWVESIGHSRRMVVVGWERVAVCRTVSR